MFHNDGAKNGIIKNIKIGFKHDQEVKYLDISGKAKLTELTNMSGRREDDYLSCKVYQSHINDNHPEYNDFIILDISA